MLHNDDAARRVTMILQSRGSTGYGRISQQDIVFSGSSNLTQKSFNLSLQGASPGLLTKRCGQCYFLGRNYYGTASGSTRKLGYSHLLQKGTVFHSHPDVFFKPGPFYMGDEF